MGLEIEQSGQLTTGRPEVRPEGGRVAHPDELLQRLDERTERRGHDGVTRSVQHEHSVPGRPLRELLDQPALAGARLTADQHDPLARFRRTGQKLPEDAQLPRAADKGSQRDVAQGTGKR